MDTGYYKFYDNKHGLILLVFIFLMFACVSCASLCFLIIDDRVAKNEQIINVALIICCFIILSALISSKLLSKKVYIEVTPSYIQIDDFEPLRWTDISRTYKCNMARARGGILVLEVRDISKYNLTLNQKLIMKTGLPPFFISRAILKPEDWLTLVHILEGHVENFSF